MLRHLLLILALLPLGIAAESATLPSRLAAAKGGKLSPAERCALVDEASRSSGDQTAVLSSLAADRCRLVREHAIGAIRSVLPARMDILANALAAERSPAARAGAAFAAVTAREWAALDLLARLAEDQKAAALPVRLAIASALAALDRDPSPKAGIRATAIATSLTTDKDLRVRLAAIAALARRGPLAEAQRTLEILALDPVEEVARQALEALLGTGADPGRLTTACSRRLRSSSDPRERIVLCNALGRLGGTAAAEALLDTLATALDNTRASELRAAICDALGQIASEDPAVIKRCEAVLPALALRERWVGTRMAALWALLRMGSSLAIPTAIEALPRQGDDDLVWLLRKHTGMNCTRREEWQTWWKAAAATWQPRRIATQAISSVDFYEVQDATDAVAFVIDVSGSMAQPMTVVGAYGQPDIVGTKLEAAKRELWRSLRELEAGTRVSLTWFSTGVATWGDGPVLATWRNKARLRDAFANIPPSGATNAWGAMAAALDGAGATAIYFLTDGQPTVGESVDPAAITAEMAERNLDRPQLARIHSLAFHMQIDASDGGPAKERARLNREAQERRAQAAGKQLPPEDPAIEAARGFLRRLSADSGGTFREIQ